MRIISRATLRTIKKLTSWVLVFCMLFSQIPISPITAIAVEDIALNKPIVNSTASYLTNTADKAVDGDISTGWGSYDAVPSYITIDLGNGSDLRYNIEGFSLYVEHTTQYPADFQIQGSNSPTSGFVTLYSKTGNTNNDIDQSISSTGYYRYIRFYATKCSTTPNEYYLLNSFRVYGALGVKDNSGLTTLTTSAGTLSPAFDSGTYNYTLAVPQASSSVSITPTLADDNTYMTINYNGNTVTHTSGQPYTVSNLNYGYNSPVAINTYSQDGSIIKTYTVNITRGDDIALNKPIVNSTLCYLTNTADKAVDGDESTGFGNYEVVPSYITIDLGNGYNINAFRLYEAHPTQYPADFQIQGSNSPTSGFVTLYSTTGNTNHNINQSISSSGYYRYVRLYVTKSTSTPNEYYLVNTFSVCGTLGSSTATLSSLTTSAGTLSPAFASETTSYTINVPITTTTLNFTPTLSDSTGSLKINNVAVTNAQPYTANLNVGANTYTITTLAQDGFTTKTYTLTINRGGTPDLALNKTITNTSGSNGGSQTPNYAIDGSDSTCWCSTNVTPSYFTVDLGAGYNITGYNLYSNSSQYPKNYQIQGSTDGTNFTNLYSVSNNSSQTKCEVISTSGYYRYIRLNITAASLTPNEYVYVHTFNLTGTAGNTTSTLASLTTSTGTLSPAFASGTTSYTMSVPEATSSINFTPTLTDNTGSITVNGSAVANGAAKNVNLDYGPNTVTIVSTSQDNNNKTTYTINITRGTDLALNKPITASSTYLGAGGPATNANDGNPSTRWCCESPGSASWLTVDLGAGNRYNITGYKFFVDTSQYPRNYSIQGSNDGSSFTTLYSVSSNVSASKSETISTTGYYRYIRLYIANSSTTPNEYVYINSLMFYGTLGVTSNAGLATLTNSTGTLTPAFATSTYDYTLNVSPATTSVSITPTLIDAASYAYMTINNGVNTVTQTSGQPYTISDLNYGSNRPITITTYSQDASVVKTYNLKIYRGIDLALNKAISNNSGYHSAPYVPANAIDGDYNSMYINDATVPAYYTIDLGGASNLRYNINAFSIYVPNSNTQYPVDYQIQGSNDLSSYTTLYAKTGNTLHTINQSISTTGYYRYLRVYVTKSSSSPNEYFYIYNFSVLGTLGIKENNGLTSLTTSAGTLTPAFASSTYNYTLNVPQASSSVSITPTLADSNTYMTINYNGNTITQTSGQPYTVSNLSYGLNKPVTINTYSEDGSIVKTYTLKIYRGTDLAAGKPIVNSTAYYSADWSPPKAIDNDLNTPYVNNATVPAYFTIDLGNGSDLRYNINAFSIYVPDNNTQYPVDYQIQGSNSPDSGFTAIYSKTGNTYHTINQSVSTTEYYRYIRVYVTKSSSSPNEYFYIYNFAVCGTLGVKDNNGLSTLTSTGTLYPTFASSTYNYTLNVPQASSSVSITPTLADANTYMKINYNGSTVTHTSGQSYTINDLIFGSNRPITITTYSQDGSLVKTYNLKLYRGTDLALNKPIVNKTDSISSNDPNYLPTKALDDNLDSTYINNAVVPAYFTIDLGNGSDVRYNINGFGIYVPNSNTQYPVDYQIQASNSPSSGFVTLYSKTGNNLHTINQNVSTTGFYRYIRIYVTKSSTSPNEYFYIYNFSVMGQPAYKVTYDGNNSTTGTVPTDNTQYMGQNATVLANSGNLLRTGYTYNEWNTEADGTGTNYAAAQTMAVSSNVTLYAKWTPNVYTVTLDPQTGSVSPESIDLAYDTTYAALPTPTKTGHTFGGWWTGPDGTGTEMTSETVVKITEHTTLYAKWTLTQYTVSFNEDGGSEVTDITQAYNTTIDSEPAITKTGYTFGGWYTDAELSNAVTYPYTITDNATFYAKWTINQYTVSFNEDGGSEVTNITQNYNTTIDSAPAISKTGYTFEGWFTDEGLTNTVAYPYTIGASNVTWYAKWTINQYTVTYNEDGGSEVADVTQNYNTSIDSTPTTTKSGYTFNGWYLDSEFSSSAEFPYTIIGNATIYAKFTINQYTVSVTENGGDSIADITQNYNTTIDSAPAIYKTGYTFVGWFTDEGLTNAVTYPYTITDNATFYAKWAINQYTVSFEENGGNAIGDITQDYNTTIASAPIMAKTGYTLDGWYSNAEFTTSVTFPYTITGNATLYAKWTINQYTISIVENGGSEIDDITQDYNTTITSAPVTTKTGYTFSGWFTDVGLTHAVSYPYTVTNNATFYAKWTINQYAITFNEDGGSNVADITQDYNTTIASAPAITKTGYTFGGWYLDSELNNAVTYPYTITGNATLYAKWTINQYTVSFEENGGTIVTDVTQNYNTTITSAPAITKTGYTFGGWYLDSGLTTAVTYPYTITDNVTFYAKWTINPYTVSFYEDGGSAVTDITQDYNTTIATAPTTTKTGYTFGGWYTNEGLTTVAEFPYTITDNATIYAKWTINQYTVAYNEDGGSDVADVIQNYNTTIDSAPTTTKTGYTFGGWYTNEGLTTVAEFPYTITDNATIYAKWTINQYTVSYDANTATGGTIPADQVTYDYGTNITVLDNTNTLVKTGYTFAGWNTAADGNGTSYTGGNTFNLGAGNVVLYAKWNINSYAVSYDPNGNTGGTVPDGSSYNYGTTIIVSGNTGTLVKTGYTFAGWNTKADGLGTTYTANQTFVLEDSAVTLYAIWNVKGFEVVYDGNGSDGGTLPAGGGYNYGTNITVAAEGTLEKTGFTFLDWNTKADGSGTTYYPGDIFSLGAADVTLYAEWEVNLYNVTYDGNGFTEGTVPATGQYAYNTTATVATKGTLAKTGYTFDGWNTKADGLGTSYDENQTFALGDKDVTLYAQWTCNNYEVSYNDNGSTGGTAPTGGTHAYSSSITVSDNTGSLVRLGYTFAGWNTKADGTGSNYQATNTFSLGAADVILYAKWNINSYTVCYDTNGATGGTVPNSSDHIFGSPITVSDNTGTLVRTGYEFSGWNTKADGTGDTFVANDTFNLGASSVTLYAKWTNCTYTVTYNSNGGSSIISDDVIYNSFVTEPTVPTKPGHTFAGWYKDTNLAFGWTFATDKMPAANMTLNAKWIPIQYTVSFTENGGSTVTDVTQDYNTTITSAPAITRAGYTFGGWYTDEELSTAVTYPYTITDDATFYAKWTINQYTVSFNENGGSTVTDLTQNYDTTIETEPSITKADYTFGGWYLDSGFTTAVTYPYTITDNVTFYAKWTINQYTVTFNEDGGSAVTDITQDCNTTIASSPVTTKTGYTFSGWYTDEELTNAVTFPYMITANATFYAKWTINQHTVSFEENGGSEVSGITQNYNTTIASAPSITKAGYTFGGWFTDSGLTTAVSYPYTITDNAIFYAKWTINQYTITFSEDGGSEVTDITQDYNTTITSAPVTTKTGYTFGGWFIDSALTTAVAYPYTITDDATLYAKWNINQYTITFVEDGGSTVADITQNYNTSIVSAPTITKAGYTFGGWYTDAGLTSAVTYPYTITNNASFYAKWTINQYTIIMNEDGGDAIADITQDYDTSIISAPAITRTGYTFSGWYLDSALTTAVTYPYSITDNAAFYAKWTINQYTVSFNEDGGSAVTDVTLDYNTAIESTPVTTKTGYTFGSWYTDSSLTTAATFPYTIGASNVTLYAKWTVNQYTVTLNEDGGSEATDITQEYNTTITSAPVTTKTGYTFSGWYTDAELANAVTYPYTITNNAALYAKWNINQYTVSFNEDGGSAVTDVTQDYNTTIEASPETEKTGYTFGGWYTNSSLTAATFPYTIGASNVTFYAKWTINQYTVSLEENGGSEVADITQDYNTTIASQPTPPTKTGSTFMGWYTDSLYVDEVTYPYTITDNATFYAKWMVNPYTISFEENGGSSITDIIQEYHSTIDSAPTAPTKTGYTFAGWYAEAGLTTAITYPYTINGNATFYAKWDINQYSVSFNVDGGNAVANIEQDYNTTIDSAPVTAKTGYTFNGWYLDPGLTVAVTYPYTITDNTMFCAKWTINQYTVTYNENGGSEVTDVTQNYYTTIDTAPTPTKTGYTFDGWYTESALENEATFPYTIEDNVSLFAKWNINSYTINYNANSASGGTIPATETTETYGSSITVAENTGLLVKEGYTFKGWNTAANGSGTTYAPNDTFLLGAANVTLYAQWQINSYKVSYDGNGFTGGSVPANADYDYGQTVTVSGNTGSLVKTGYTFTGWNTKSDGLGSPYDFSDTFDMGAGVVTLYAQWHINSYVVTYNGNGNDAGTLPDSDTYVYSTDITVSSEGDLSKTGHTFIDWNTNADGSGTTYFPDDVFSLGASDITLYAIWETNSYTLTYDGNGFTGGTVPVSGQFPYSTTATVSSKGTLVRKGYSFTGWNTKAAGNGTPYAENETFALGTSDVTLYAQWQINSYSVSYDDNGSTSGTVPTGGSHEYNSNITVSQNTGTLVKTGYTFVGWNTAANGSGTSYAPNDAFLLGEGDVTLYAQWQINSYTVSYDGNGAVSGTVPANMNYQYSALVTVSGNTGSLAKTGYSFAGWNTKADGSGFGYVSSDTFNMGDAVVTLYAQWTINQYTVSFDENGGTTVTDVTQVYNTTIDSAPTITRTGHTFAGWYSNSGLTSVVSFPYTIGASNTTFYAKWIVNQYSVEFEENGGSTVANITQNYETTLVASPTVTKTGYTFSGWYTEPEFTNLVLFPYSIGSTNVTFYAKWTINQYTVSFNENGGSDVTDITQDFNSTIDTAPTSTKLHYTLSGWYSDAGLTNAVTFPYTIGASNKTLYAKWTIDQHTISLEENGGNATADVVQDYNSTIDSAPAVTYPGYSFEGWYSDAGLTTAITYPYTVTANSTFYAKWSINQYTATFEENGGSAVTDVTQEFNTSITEPTEPTKEGYVFYGWYKDSTFNNQWDFSTDKIGPANFTLYARWIKKGDVNFDGYINSLDARIVLKNTVGSITFTDLQNKVADVNSDNVVDSLDARMILIITVSPD